MTTIAFTYRLHCSSLMANWIPGGQMSYPKKDRTMWGTEFNFGNSPRFLRWILSQPGGADMVRDEFLEMAGFDRVFTINLIRNIGKGDKSVPSGLVNGRFLVDLTGPDCARMVDAESSIAGHAAGLRQAADTVQCSARERKTIEYQIKVASRQTSSLSHPDDVPGLMKLSPRERWALARRVGLWNAGGLWLSVNLLCQYERPNRATKALLGELVESGYLLTAYRMCKKCVGENTSHWAVHQLSSALTRHTTWKFVAGRGSRSGRYTRSSYVGSRGYEEVEDVPIDIHMLYENAVWEVPTF